MRIAYHIIEDFVTQESRQLLRECLSEYTDDVMNLVHDPIQDIANEICFTSTIEMLHEIVQNLVDEIVDAQIIDTQSQLIYKELLDSVLHELDIVKDSLESVELDHVFEKMVDHEIECQVREFSGFKLVEQETKSEFVDWMMDFMMDEIASVIMVTDEYYMGEALDAVLDGILAEVVVSDYVGHVGYLNQLEDSNI